MFSAVLRPALGEPLKDRENEKISYFSPFTYGMPKEPSETWTLSYGGRLYDKWYTALGKDGPQTTHPSWPASNRNVSGADTWRCKACHGWDYNGKDGRYKSGDNATGIIGVRGAIGKPVSEIVKIITDSTHQYTTDMIDEKSMKWLAEFIVTGQDHTDRYVNENGEVSGKVVTGKNLFQNVCASCHGYDGKSRNWGDENSPAYVGTEANANPWEVFHKIRNGHPGFYMISLRGIPTQFSADVLAYVKTLPVK